MGLTWKMAVLATECCVVVLTEACSRLDLRRKAQSNCEFGGEPRLPQIMFTEPHRGSDGPFHMKSYCNNSWTGTFLGYHTTIHVNKLQTTKTLFFPKHMITFSAGVTLVESCAGRKFGDVIGQ